MAAETSVQVRAGASHARAGAARTGILLVNLGTPDEPTPAAVRRYLTEFLSDPRVVEIPRLLWLPILYGLILPRRPAVSARKYAAIWTPEGSPLRVHTERQARLLEGFLSQQVRAPFSVAWAMRYGRPSIADGLNGLVTAGCGRILVLPLYPQYSDSATGSVLDAVAKALPALSPAPELRQVRNFHDAPAHIGALAASVRRQWEKHGRGDLLLMSFHGLPRYTHERGDPYFTQCQATAALLAQALGLDQAAWRASFQSRFGRAEWLRPYTVDTLAELARAGRRVDVICPGFPSDCLETLEEIGIEGRALFESAGGKGFALIPCLNEDDAWVHALAGLVREHAGPWLQPPQQPKTT